MRPSISSQEFKLAITWRDCDILLIGRLFVFNNEQFFIFFLGQPLYETFEQCFLYMKHCSIVNTWEGKHVSLDSPAVFAYYPKLALEAMVFIRHGYSFFSRVWIGPANQTTATIQELNPRSPAFKTRDFHCTVVAFAE